MLTQTLLTLTLTLTLTMRSSEAHVTLTNPNPKTGQSLHYSKERRCTSHYSFNRCILAAIAGSIAQICTEFRLLRYAY